MEIGYIDREEGKTLLQETEEISLMLGGLMKTKKGFLSQQ